MQIRCVLLCALLLAPLLAACGAPELAPTRGYLLVSIDTLRADHLSTYGYERNTSPFLDHLAGRGVVFENAIASFPGTLPSHMSIFTGFYPQEHGVYPPDHVLSEKLQTLPEIFRRAGYHTAGFTEGGFMKGDYGFGRGFDHFSDRVEGTSRDLETTLERARSFLRQVPENEPFFLFLHTYAVHTPYAPPPPYDEMFWDGAAPVGAPPPTGPRLQRLNSIGASRGRRWLPYYLAQYDGSIAYADSLLEEFFAELAETGVLADLTVVILSDHGEEFLEHGLFVHEQLYDETMRVPLLFLHPEIIGPVRVERLVELIDVPATLLDLAGLRAPRRLSGRSLVPLLVGREESGSTTAFGLVSASRTLYYQDDGRLLQLIVDRHPGDEWLGKRTVFDLPPGRDVFSIRSFREPRRIRVKVGRKRARSYTISTDWQRIDIARPTLAEPVRILVIADTCTWVRVRSRRCLSFQVTDPAPERVELFELTSIRSESEDISRRETETVDQLMRRLRDYRLSALEPPTITPPNEALNERLRALGYIE